MRHVPLALALTASSVGLTVGLLAPSSVAKAETTCTVKVTMTNHSLEETYSLASKSQVKVQGEGWRPLGHRTRARVGPDRSQTVSLTLPGACSDQRRYRFQIDVVGHDESFVYEYPSTSGWTRDTTIDLGDVSRFFWQLSQGD